MNPPNPSASTMPGLTLNFDAAGMSDKIEEELNKENEEQQKKIRELLEAELNDDDLLSDDDDSEELSQMDPNTEDDELRNTDDLTQRMQQMHEQEHHQHQQIQQNQQHQQQQQYQHIQQPHHHQLQHQHQQNLYETPTRSGQILSRTSQDRSPMPIQNTHLSYEELLDFYKERGNELNNLQKLIEENRQEHQRTVRAEQHKAAQIESECLNFKLEAERKGEKLVELDGNIVDLQKQNIDLNETISHLKSLNSEQDDKIYEYTNQISDLQQQLSESLSSDKMAALRIDYEHQLEQQKSNFESESFDMRSELNDLKRELQSKEIEYNNFEKILRKGIFRG